MADIASTADTTSKASSDLAKLIQSAATSETLVCDLLCGKQSVAFTKVVHCIRRLTQQCSDLDESGYVANSAKQSDGDAPLRNVSPYSSESLRHGFEMVRTAIERLATITERTAGTLPGDAARTFGPSYPYVSLLLMPCILLMACELQASPNVDILDENQLWAELSVLMRLQYQSLVSVSMSSTSGDGNANLLSVAALPYISQSRNAGGSSNAKDNNAVPENALQARALSWPTISRFSGYKTIDASSFPVLLSVVCCGLARLLDILCAASDGGACAVQAVVVSQGSQRKLAPGVKTMIESVLDLIGNNKFGSWAIRDSALRLGATSLLCVCGSLLSKSGDTSRYVQVQKSGGGNPNEVPLVSQWVSTAQLMLSVAAHTGDVVCTRALYPLVVGLEL